MLDIHWSSTGRSHLWLGWKVFPSPNTSENSSFRTLLYIKTDRAHSSLWQALKDRVRNPCWRWIFPSCFRMKKYRLADWCSESIFLKLGFWPIGKIWTWVRLFGLRFAFCWWILALLLLKITSFLSKLDANCLDFLSEQNLFCRQVQQWLYIFWRESRLKRWLYLTDRIDVLF